jgi:hypothetical protein
VPVVADIGEHSRHVPDDRAVVWRRFTMISKSKGTQIQMVGYYAPEAVKGLKKLSEQTRVPQAAYLWEALEDLLKKYAAEMRRAT